MPTCPSILRQLSIALALCLAASACTPQLQSAPSTAEIESLGMLALHAQQAQARATLRHWADQGLPVAQRELGLALFEKDPRSACNWLTQAAGNGDQAAQFALAEVFYKARLGVTKNLTLAQRWYAAAAAQGNDKANFMLARMAKYGEGGPLDLPLSVHYLQLASDQGNAQAMFLLANAYAAGAGVATDPLRAHAWLERSAAGDYAVAIHALALELEGTDQQQAKHLIKEARDERLMHWNQYQ
ncbi:MULTISPECIES: tetratricopeptide repeat protein [unclassified Undibacterium]|uniref:tetratricopeptide repeat protein n=1 Tax=unclassified Undibacterium TaxID=2630295 RepID=UPI002AC8E8E8|nr:MULTISPECIES: tetratricopeptide repeat protein [unclassified Undibacterium]MEB0138500.1 tetratricopeptide repeat protein [Undibacterium sp. CCC2.1]MEB0173099.1 tetratricopeptide repeat protein [Undibacterium sp. CCC1.1]MEB0176151.1 tetratricopeptide repeat protein [Undibacterium sp. CCC3.4]MEB0215417.1 tetratricopeptide repeat protein [Undibacterium sp. 5I2]WPX42758.1 tetratricopeptide repeat protein [Undibacterium sp. CCC3.4]